MPEEGKEFILARKSSVPRGDHGRYIVCYEILPDGTENKKESITISKKVFKKKRKLRKKGGELILIDVDDFGCRTASKNGSRGGIFAEDARPYNPKKDRVKIPQYSDDVLRRLLEEF